ncbi:MAG: hypothetical protein BAJALOKI2v1_400041 [Promethearchaeota archaeon]|nr:MAG: hypothetical protein BAJALOKI2v1_400041 [Candidatus Lokiarchaeota archaeon]
MVVPTPFASGDKVAVPPDSRKRQYPSFSVSQARLYFLNKKT